MLGTNLWTSKPSPNFIKLLKLISEFIVILLLLISISATLLSPVPGYPPILSTWEYVVVLCTIVKNNLPGLISLKKPIRILKSFPLFNFNI